MSRPIYAGRARRPFPFWTVGLIVYLAAIFLALAADEYYWSQAFRMGPVREVMGTITHLEESYSRSSSDYYIEYSYHDTTGLLRSGISKVSTAAWIDDKVGTPVRVEVLTGDEGRSRLPDSLSALPGNLLFGVGGLVCAVLVGLSRNVYGGTRHIRFDPPASAPLRAEPVRVFRAPINEHWPFSLMLSGLGLMIFYVATLPMVPLPYDAALLGAICVVPAALFLLALPLIFHFWFYVKVTDTHLEARGLGPSRRIAWRELSDVWLYRTPEVDFMSNGGSVSIHFKLFPRECQRMVRERIHELFGTSF